MALQEQEATVHACGPAQLGFVRRPTRHNRQGKASPPTPRTGGETPHAAQEGERSPDSSGPGCCLPSAEASFGGRWELGSPTGEADRRMTRGKQKIDAQRRSAEKNQKPKGSQLEARAVGLKVICPICKVQLANEKQLIDHYGSKHPKQNAPSPSE